MFKKVITLLFGTAFMVVLMLAAGGVYLLPENFMGAYMYADVWAAAVAVILLLARIFISMYPGYSYEELRSMGYSDYEARKLI